MIFMKRDAPIVRSIIARGQPAVFEVTTNTMVVKPLEGTVNYLLSDNRMNGKELQFIKRVKEEVLSLQLAMPDFDHTKIAYHQYSRERTFINMMPILGAVEIDLDSAYWNIARRLGYIDDQLHAEGRKVKKVVRLAGLGALAMRKEIYNFAGGDGEPELIETRMNERGRQIFRHICHVTGELMKRAAIWAGLDDFYFYYVDAIFVTPQRAEAIQEFLSLEGYEFKVKNVHAIDYQSSPRSKVIVYDYRHQWENRDNPSHFIENEKPRAFSCPKLMNDIPRRLKNYKR